MPLLEFRAVPTPAPSPTVPSVVAEKASRAVDERALRTLFHEARTANGYLPTPVPTELLEKIVELAGLGPTSGNAQPLRVVFVRSAEGKARVLPAVAPGNVEKATAAPVTAILATDLRFYEHLPRLFPHKDIRAAFVGDENTEIARQFGTMNATLQAAYLMLAARAVGLDAGPMGGFDRDKVDAEFFPDGSLKTLFLVNLGYGDDAKLFERNPRLAFGEVAQYA